MGGAGEGKEGKEGMMSLLGSLLDGSGGLKVDGAALAGGQCVLGCLASFAPSADLLKAPVLLPPQVPCPSQVQP